MISSPGELEALEKMAEIAKRYNLSRLEYHGIIIDNTKPDPMPSAVKEMLTQISKPPTDDELLADPYAGLPK